MDYRHLQKLNLFTSGFAILSEVERTKQKLAIRNSGITYQDESN
jgi:hypothetical protein